MRKGKAVIGILVIGLVMVALGFVLALWGLASMFVGCIVAIYMSGWPCPKGLWMYPYFTLSNSFAVFVGVMLVISGLYILIQTRR